MSVLKYSNTCIGDNAMGSPGCGAAGPAGVYIGSAAQKQERTRYKQGFPFSSTCSTAISLQWVARRRRRSGRLRLQMGETATDRPGVCSLDDVVALAEHQQQGDLAERGRRHTFLLHLRVEERTKQQAGRVNQPAIDLPPCRTTSIAPAIAHSTPGSNRARTTGLITTPPREVGGGTTPKTAARGVTNTGKCPCRF